MNEDKANQKDRLQRLTTPAQKQTKHNPRYSLFIRRMRLVLPAIAIAIAAIVFTWSTVTKEILIPLENGDLTVQTIGKNELINPRFESRDNKGQPFTITAKRAIQGKENEDLIILEQPIADILLQSGEKINMKALQGAYRQDNRRLLLNGSVQLFHSSGYTLNTEELHIDIAQNQTWSDETVFTEGSAGTIAAQGLRGDGNTQTLKFIGPTKMVIKDGKLGALATAPKQEVIDEKF